MAGGFWLLVQLDFGQRSPVFVFERGFIYHHDMRQQPSNSPRSSNHDCEVFLEFEEIKEGF
jgi:hypothetical protein